MAIDIELELEAVYNTNNMLIYKIINLERQRLLLIATLERIYIDEQDKLSKETLKRIKQVNKECAGLL